jgi:membrane-bound serine protease (ClpP class)
MIGIHAIQLIPSIIRHALLAFMGLVTLFFTPLSSDAAGNSQNPITVLTIKGAISPAYSDYLKHGLKHAKKTKSQLIIIELDTPGGVLTTTREMAQDILTSEIPIAVFVTPAGAHAASAGTFILYAAHIAAMSPGTNTGAATPVQMMPGASPTDKNKDKPDETSKNDDQDASEDQKHPLKDSLLDRLRNDGSNEERLNNKTLEDTSAFIRSLATFRGRNAEWAEEAVINADSIIAHEALEKGVIDYMAQDRFDLLRQIDGKTITINDKKSVTLNVKQAPIIEQNPGWRTKLLAFLTDPNIAYFLLIIGINGLILEFYNPGTMIAGVIGSVCLVLALMAMHVLPINTTGLIMVILGLIFLAGEAFMPSFGVMGIGGLITFILGSLILFDADAMGGIGLDMSSIIIAAGFSGLLIGIAIFVLIKLRTLKNTTGMESMINSHATVTQWDGREGHVDLYGESWLARADRILALSEGEKIKITGKDGLTLLIDELSEDKSTDHEATTKPQTKKPDDF